MAYYIMLLMGSGSLLPWNAVVTAIDYFMFIFEDDQKLSDDCGVYFGVSYNYPNLIGLIFLLNYGHLYSLESKISFGFYLFLAMFVFIPLINVFGLDIMTSFVLHCAAIGVLGGATSIALGSLFGFAGRLGPRFTEAVMAGNGVAGILMILARVLTKGVLRDDEDGITDDEKEDRLLTATWIYFAMAILNIIMCIVMFKRLLHLNDVKILLSPGEDLPLADENGNETNDATPLKDFSSSTPTEDEAPQFLRNLVGDYTANVLYRIRWMAFCVSFTLGTTLSVFPGIILQIDSNDGIDDWMAVTIIAVFCVGDYIGRSAPAVVPLPSDTTLCWSVFLRFLITYPLTFMCLDTVVQDKMVSTDVLVMILVFVFAVSNGFFSTASMIRGPSLAHADEKDSAGVLMTVFLNTGLTVGSTLGIPLSFLIKSDDDE
eukprot:TRINITY_DN874_c0_g1::TRINITY_DN874_c0_g1_i1::g.25411::m.25411 TRINITY_DN874_c0_g1::TRINITY_DN874_c0_g1_i1::g.25411  ORF type:complete len:485 (+),score=169.73,sp/Q84XI3/ENT8_ARATH/27.49/5e-42,Nucleoside_tran/PF01733.13/3.6e+03,Nucleoside_tran/PF01733.13/4.1e+03,Nucleoside_tran/PF01733.13/3.4e-43,Calcyon/PF06387.6/0.088 TRINITY_DN874_c0_g1_i1:166-1455(+)